MRLAERRRRGWILRGWLAFTIARCLRDEARDALNVSPTLTRDDQLRVRACLRAADRFQRSAERRRRGEARHAS